MCSHISSCMCDIVWCGSSISRNNRRDKLLSPRRLPGLPSRPALPAASPVPGPAARRSPPAAPGRRRRTERIHGPARVAIATAAPGPGSGPAPRAAALVVPARPAAPLAAARGRAVRASPFFLSSVYFIRRHIHRRERCPSALRQPPGRWPALRRHGGGATRGTPRSAGGSASLPQPTAPARCRRPGLPAAARAVRGSDAPGGGAGRAGSAQLCSARRRRHPQATPGSAGTHGPAYTGPPRSAGGGSAAAR